jgi:two-component system sensor histidine kinase HydH
VNTLAVDQNEQLRGRLKWGLFFRVALASVFLGLLALVDLQSAGQGYAVPINLLLLAIIATYALTILSALLLVRLKGLVAFAYAQILFDVALTTWVILVTGGADSPFGFLYSLGVVNAAILLSTPGAVTSAAISSMRLSSAQCACGAP